MLGSSVLECGANLKAAPLWNFGDIMIFDVRSQSRNFNIPVVLSAFLQL